jgi:hypothetical protein
MNLSGHDAPVTDDDYIEDEQVGEGSQYRER